VKYGKTGWYNQRYKCKDCGKVMNAPIQVRQVEICESSGNSHAYSVIRKFQRNRQTVGGQQRRSLKMDKKLCEKHWASEDPTSVERAIVVLDEMWHFVNGKPNKVWL
jgi:hypothetical protein